MPRGNVCVASQLELTEPPSLSPHPQLAAYRICSVHDGAILSRPLREIHYLRGSRNPLTRANVDFTASTMCPAVKPKCLNSSAAGADSPNVVIPITAPDRPTYF